MLPELYFKDSRCRLFMHYFIWYAEHEWDRHHQNILQGSTTLARYQALHLMANFVSAANFLLLSMFDRSSDIKTIGDAREYILDYCKNIAEYPIPPEFNESAYFMALGRSTNNLQDWFTIKCIIQNPLLGQVLKDLYTIYEPPQKAVEFLTRANHIDIYIVSRMPIYILSKIRRNEPLLDIAAIHQSVSRVKQAYSNPITKLLAGTTSSNANPSSMYNSNDFYNNNSSNNYNQNPTQDYIQPAFNSDFEKQNQQPSMNNYSNNQESTSKYSQKLSLRKKYETMHNQENENNFQPVRNQPTNSSNNFLNPAVDYNTSFSGNPNNSNTTGFIDKNQQQPMLPQFLPTPPPEIPIHPRLRGK